MKGRQVILINKSLNHIGSRVVVGTVWTSLGSAKNDCRIFCHIP